MILVTGATGYLGGEVCRRLRVDGREVRGLVRSTSSPDRVAALRDMGVGIVQADLKDPGSLREACSGVEAVISGATATRSRGPDDTLAAVDRDGQQDLVDAAAGAGAEAFVFVSYSGNFTSDDPLTRAKRSVERHLAGSGIPRTTVLRPSMFMESWLAPALGFDHPEGKVTIYGTGENAVSWISLEDVAAFAVASLEHELAAGATLELGGPDDLTPHEVVALFEEVTGRDFDVVHVPEGVLRGRMEQAEDPLDEAFAALMLAYAAGDRIDSAELADAMGVRRTTVREYAERVAG